jgi:hypothetical protein
MAVNFFDNFSIQTDKPIDIRHIVNCKSDLTNSASFTNGLYAYKGMIVTVLDDSNLCNNSGSVQTYVLTSNKSGYTIETNWRKFSVGANYLNYLEDVTISNPTNGEILVYNLTSQKWENAGPVVKTITQYSGTDKTGFTVLKTDGTSEFIVIDERDDTVVFATETEAGIVEISTLDDIRNSNDSGESGAIVVTKASDVYQFVIENIKLVYPPPEFPISAGTIGTWSYDDRYMYVCLPNGTAGTSEHIWRRSRLDVW